MELFYVAVFLLSALAAAALEGTRKAESGSAIANRDFLKFRNNYVLVYALMMGEAHHFMQRVKTWWSDVPQRQTNFCADNLPDM